MNRLEINNGQDFLEYREAPGDTVEIVDIAVNSERRKGNGTKLMRMLEEKFPRSKFYAFSRHENAIARRFYARNGYRQITVTRFYPDGDAFLHIK